MMTRQRCIRTAAISLTTMLLAGVALAQSVDTLVADFGASGVHLRHEYAEPPWSLLHPLSPTAMVTAELDGGICLASDECASGDCCPYIEELIMSYGPLGLWALYNNTTWEKLHNLPAQNLAAVDLDGEGEDDLIVDFGSPFGIWVLFNNESWEQIHPLSADGIVAGYFFYDTLLGTGPGAALFDFGPLGTWILRELEWTKLHPLSPEAMHFTSLDCDSATDLLFDFGALGVWALLNDDEWMLVHPGNPDDSIAGNFGYTEHLSGDCGGYEDIVLSFGSAGTWALVDFYEWRQIHPLGAAALAKGNLANSKGIDMPGRQEVIIGFDGFGLWQLENLTDWSFLHTAIPEDMTAGRILVME